MFFPSKDNNLIPHFCQVIFSFLFLPVRVPRVLVQKAMPAPPPAPMAANLQSRFLL
jgi:hypothetical protein